MKKIVLLISVISYFSFNVSAQDQTINGNLHISNTSGGGLRIGKINDIGNRNVPVGGLTAQYNIDFTGFRDIQPNQIGARIAALRLNKYMENSPLIQKTALAFYTNAEGDNAGVTDLKERMRITPEGNIGIGTTNPSAKLDVDGTVRGKGLFLNYSTNEGWMRSYLQYQGNSLIIGNPAGYPHNCNIDILPGGVNNQTLTSWLNMYIATGVQQYTKKIQIHTAGDSFLNGGNVGIGTSTPQAKLDVKGRILAEEVEIKVSSGADFVFEPSYKLKPLVEVEAFVKEKKHLPEIPSEKEMVEKGVNVNEMQIKLLQKIEELTLYTIQLEKNYIELKQKLELLEQNK